MPDEITVPQSAPDRNDLDALTFPPPGNLAQASLTSLLLHALTSGEGDPLEELLLALGQRVQGLAIASSRTGHGPTGVELYSVERSVAALAEIRRRQVERAGRTISAAEETRV